MNNAIGTLSLAFLLAGCAAGAMGSAGGQAGATLNDAGGSTRAVATLAPRSNGVAVRIDASGMAPGTYGAHVHTTGRCDAPDFTSAGPHWNPTSQQHGRQNPQGAHAGDLPNLVVAANGRGSVSFTIPRAGLTDGPLPMLDADGAAVIVHATADDMRTDPSGNSGARIACGVVGLR